MGKRSVRERRGSFARVRGRAQLRLVLYIHESLRCEKKEKKRKKSSRKYKNLVYLFSLSLFLPLFLSSFPSSFLTISLLLQQSPTTSHLPVYGAHYSHLLIFMHSFQDIVNQKYNNSIFMEVGVCLSDNAWNYFRLHRDNLTNVDKLFSSSYLRTIGCPPGQYNQMASLMQTSGKNMVSLLFANGMYDMLSLWALALFLVIYFLLAAITASLSVPAGMVVPSLIIGGCLGRIMAIIVNMSVKRWLGQVLVDPGTWAMVGAAAFWCGSARITVTIAVIIMEITGDFRFVPAIAMAVMFAKLTGQFLTDSVYHMMIHIKKIPFMEDIPARVMDDTFVFDIMVTADKVTSVPVFSENASLKGALSTSHNGFPVTEEKGGKIRLVGLISREQILEALKSPEAHLGSTINLRDFMNETPVTVLPSFTMTQAFK